MGPWRLDDPALRVVSSLTTTATSRDNHLNPTRRAYELGLALHLQHGYHDLVQFFTMLLFFSTTLFSNTFFYAAYLLDAAVLTTPCSKYFSFYLSDCAGAWVLILSTLPPRLKQPWDGYVFISPNLTISIGSRANQQSPVLMSMRCGDLGRWAPHVVCTDGMDYWLIGYARHRATWSFGDALLVSSWLITACCAGWTGLGHCSLGSCCLETIFGVFILILILWTFLCMGDLNLSESMACTIE